MSTSTAQISTAINGELLAQEPELIDASQAAALRGVNRDSWHRLVREGKAPRPQSDTEPWQWRRSEVVTWIGHVPELLDGERVATLAEKCEIHQGTLRNWLRWKTHPVLGRKFRSGIGQRGVLASRADAETCVAAMRDPLHRRFPGNPGVWIAPEIFQHDNGDMYFTDRYICRHADIFGVAGCSLSQPYYLAKLTSIDVIAPGGAHERWRKRVYSQDSLKGLGNWREGKAEGGEWLSETLWQDAVDESGKRQVWYHSSVLVNHLLTHGIVKRGLSAYKKLANLRDAGLLTRRKRVPRNKRVRERGAPNSRGAAPIVYHGDEARRLLSLSREQLLDLFECANWPTDDPARGAPPAAAPKVTKANGAASAQRDPTPAAVANPTSNGHNRETHPASSTVHNRPTEARNKLWAEWNKDGFSYGEIAQKWNADKTNNVSGETVKRGTVKAALRYLRKHPASAASA